MASPFYIGNRKVKLRFLIFIVLLILGFSYMYKLLMPSYKYTSIDYKKITMEKVFQSYLFAMKWFSTHQYTERQSRM